MPLTFILIMKGQSNFIFRTSRTITKVTDAKDTILTVWTGRGGGLHTDASPLISGVARVSSARGPMLGAAPPPPPFGKSCIRPGGGGGGESTSKKAYATFATRLIQHTAMKSLYLFA